MFGGSHGWRERKDVSSPLFELLPRSSSARLDVASSSSLIPKHAFRPSRTAFDGLTLRTSGQIARRQCTGRDFEKLLPKASRHVCTSFAHSPSGSSTYQACHRVRLPGCVSKCPHLLWTTCEEGRRSKSIRHRENGRATCRDYLTL